MPVPVNDVSLQVILFLRTHFFCEKTNRHLLFLQKSFSTEALFRTHGDKKADVRFCFVHLSMNICFHRKRFTNLSSRFPDSQIFTAAAPSHAFRTMAFLQLTLPAYSDRIAQDFHLILFYLRGFFSNPFCTEKSLISFVTDYSKAVLESQMKGHGKSA